MEHVKKIVIRKNRRGVELDVVLHAARGAGALVGRVRGESGVKPSDLMATEEVRAILPNKIRT